ncbi:GntR family transcriptional regulator [Irregularibacter muris]|uniref:GntR family transcriptional regulator n=1 Tax=Irregularibacter muris TaxID=1796619 RepID=A0AAE3L089_9FIRM|nr:GntR family transcriptional regulator [Irregularibacter muris]MCR1899492.1 GntR family transcriptional regulator [Irregularibacter muris]
MNNQKESLMETKLDNYKPLREIVFQSMREAIVKGDLEPGKRLMEVQLAEQMGVSRTPVREAIRQLELEGLVVMVPRKGAYVAGLSMKDVIEVLEIRAVLEGLAADLAAKRATDEEITRLSQVLEKFTEYAEKKDVQGLIDQDVAFHDVIYGAARNERLLQLISGLREQVQRFRVMYISQFDHAMDLVKEHKKIVQAISTRNGEQARKLAQGHISNAEYYMTKEIDENVEE